MRIALLTDGIYPYVTGGMQKHSYYLAKFLARKKIYISLFHFQENNDYDIHKLELFTDEEKKYISSHVFKFPRLGSFPGHYIKESYKYSELVYEEIKNRLTEFDFIYAKGFTSWKLLEEKRKGIKSPPVGVKFHGYEMFQKPPSVKAFFEQILFLRKPVLKINKMADYVFSYGGKINDLLRQINISDSKIIEVPSGIEREWIRDTKELRIGEPINLLYIGRYERRKGVVELHKVLKKIEKGHNFKFHFVGPIPNQNRISSPKVVYHGQVTDKKSMVDIVDQCDVLVTPSYSEGMPNVILEGMARGLAVLSTDVGAVSCMVSPENGILLKEMTDENLEKALISFLAINSEKLLNMKLASIEKVVDKFLWENVVEELLVQISSRDVKFAQAMDSD